MVQAALRQILTTAITTDMRMNPSRHTKRHTKRPPNASAAPRTAAAVLATVLATLLAACAPIAPVKEDAAPRATAPNDAAEFAQRKLLPGSLAPAVTRRLPVASANPPVAFAGLTVTMAGTTVEANGQTEFSTTVLRFTNLGNGLLQRAAELSKYDIGYGTTYSLTWRGLLDLKWQEVPLRSRIVRPVIEMKNAARIDALPTEPGRDVSFEYSTGLESQASGFLPIQLGCRSTRKLPANTLHARIAGEALELDCRLRGDNALQGTSKWLVLLSYGLAIEMEQVRGTTRVTSRIADFNVRP